MSVIYRQCSFFFFFFFFQAEDGIRDLTVTGVQTCAHPISFYGDSGTDTTIYDRVEVVRGATGLLTGAGNPSASDRKSTRLNSSHSQISYAVFCLKKKKKKKSR